MLSPSLAATLLAMLVPSAPKPETGRPNVVVIMADDLGAAELGCYGNANHDTPHLDQLAREGMRFRTCYATPICSPSRVLIMTGRYGVHTGWYNFTGRPGSPTFRNPNYRLSEHEVTFGTVLRDAGYKTALAGKWQLTGERPTLIHEDGFDEYCIWAYKEYLPEGVTHTGRWEGKGKSRTARFWHPSIMKNGEYVPTKPEDYGPEIFTDFIIDFMTENKDDPFLVYYPMCLTHTPWEPAPSKESPSGKTPKGLKYNVESMDTQVGRIVATLDRLGLREKTLILFTGDNGTNNAGKGQVTEMGARVPLIASCPKTVVSDVVSDELVDLSDVFPTVLAFAGVATPSGLEIDGENLLPTLEGSKSPHRDWIFSYLHRYRLLRDRRWLLDGEGHFYDCGDRRDGKGYRDVTESKDPEVVAARARFASILAGLPAPTSIPPCPYVEKHRERLLNMSSR
ncbi:Arylsulfatase [Planctomycetes bacterium Pan216]|uniref:Arylsulfatase n=1 Tax=Kolteria novifilia TaxID=2527975 RepID=A0A518AY98_9BACT|nr:Arylsulfatase [Planctomycetes bacterium Pan216]